MLPALAAPHEYHPDLTPRRLLLLSRHIVRNFNAAYRELKCPKEGAYTAGFSRAERTRHAMDLLQASNTWLKVVVEHGPISYCVVVGESIHKPIPIRFMYSDDVPEVYDHEAAALKDLKADRPLQLDFFDYRPPGFPITAGLLRVRLKITDNGIDDLKARRVVGVRCIVLNEAGVELYSWSVWQAKEAVSAPAPFTSIPALVPLQVPADHVEAPRFQIIDEPHEDSGD